MAVAAAFVLVARPGAQTPQRTVAAPQAVPVTITHVMRQDVPITLTGLGQVQAFNAVLVRTRVDGALTGVPVAEGQEVKPGDLIAVVDPRPYKAALDQAMAKRQQDEAQLGNAKRDVERTATLAKSNIATRQLLDTQRATVDQLTAAIAGDQAAIEAAQLNLSYCYITAPIPGRIGLRQVDPGNIVHANDTGGIISIAQDHPISVVFTLPARDLAGITERMRQGKIQVAAYSGDDKTELDRGELLAPDNAIDASTGMIRLKATFQNGRNALWPGQFVEAHLLLRTEHDAVTVPAEAVQNGPSGLYVYAVKPDQTVALQPIEAETEGSIAMVTKGLTPGQEIVLRGQSRLQEGAHISVAQS